MDFFIFYKNFIERQYIKLFGDEIYKLKLNIDKLNVKYLDEIRLEKLEVNDLRLHINDLLREIASLKKQNLSAIIKQPEKLGEMHIKDMRHLLESHCKNVHLSDVIYGLTSMTKARAFSKATKLESKKWVKEKHDCDEFSFALMGYWNTGLKQFALGIAWSKIHAFNIMVDHNKKVWIIEPQTNKFIRIETIKTNKLYYPIEVIMI